MNQTTVTLIVAAICMVVFWVFTFLHQKTNVKDILTFAGLCAAAVTGVYVCLTAMQFIMHPEPETNRLTVGILGAGLALMSAREAFAMLVPVLPKRKTRTASSPKSEDNKPKPMV
ncbi:MAG: hypothetical protein WCE61_18255 [Candidatus Acidiferrum sp.]